MSHFTFWFNCKSRLLCPTLASCITIIVTIEAIAMYQKFKENFNIRLDKSNQCQNLAHKGLSLPKFYSHLIKINQEADPLYFLVFILDSNKGLYKILTIYLYNVQKVSSYEIIEHMIRYKVSCSKIDKDLQFLCKGPKSLNVAFTRLTSGGRLFCRLQNFLHTWYTGKYKSHWYLRCRSHILNYSYCYWLPTLLCLKY